MSMLAQGHPYWHVRSVIEAQKVGSVSMSYYSYQPQTVAESRTTWAISSAEFLQSASIEKIIAATPEGHELALHSNVRMLDGEERHLVMIDMSTGARAHLEKLRSFLGDHFFQQLAWFSSGRSFHGYGSVLLSKDDWVKFMGLLLLANKPRMEPTVDPRWIGHRLLGGYSALRWTKNTRHYLTPPSRIDPQKPVKASEFQVAALGKAFGSK